MKVNELETLLERYYNGGTSLEEEKQLFRYFNGGLVPPAYSREKQWFLNLQQARQLDLSPAFEEKVAGKINKLVSIKPGKSRPLLYWPYQVAALVVIAAGISFAVYTLYFTNSQAWNTTVTAAAEVREVKLSDGTKVWVNAASKLRYPDKFAEAAREVWLEGEAYFEVRPHLQKPFLVHTEKSLTSVLGTSFNIRSYEEDSIVEVTVMSGKVAFAPASNNHSEEKVLLQKGNRGTFNKNTYSIQKAPGSDPNILAWKTHKLVFEDVPLQKVLPLLEKYFAISIHAAHPQLLQCRFRGTFREAKLEEILQVIEYSLNIRANLQGNTYLLTGKGCQEN